jgi:hypothetical protein
VTTFTTTIDVGAVNLVTDDLKLRATLMCDMDALQAYISEGGDLEDSGSFPKKKKSQCLVQRLLRFSRAWPA